MIYNDLKDIIKNYSLNVFSKFLILLFGLTEYSPLRLLLSWSSYQSYMNLILVYLKTRIWLTASPKIVRDGCEYASKFPFRDEIKRQ